MPDKAARPGDSPTSRAGTDIRRELDSTQQSQKGMPTPFCLKRSNQVNGGWRLGGGHGLSRGLKAGKGRDPRAGGLEVGTGPRSRQRDEGISAIPDPGMSQSQAQGEGEAAETPQNPWLGARGLPRVVSWQHLGPGN